MILNATTDVKGKQWPRVAITALVVLAVGSASLREAFGDAEPDHATVDTAGHFRSVVYSAFSPSTRCLRVIAYASATGAESDSARVDALLVPFKHPEPDSVGLVLTLR